MEKTEQQIISDYFRELAKKRKPNSTEFYKDIQKKSVEKRKENKLKKLSTDGLA